MIMGSVKRRASKEEFARRGDAIYENDILPKLTGKDVGKFLAIDIETGEYEIAADEMRAGDKLRPPSRSTDLDGADRLCVAPQLRRPTATPGTAMITGTVKSDEARIRRRCLPYGGLIVPWPGAGRDGD
jgi:hypothetical protein